jgi:DNA-3-methyladenine glycosylase I
MAPATADSKRCWWCGSDPIYVAYHDTEWGVPVIDDVALYEKLVLDGFQAGLSWLTVLKKRDAFRKAFKGFDPVKVARFTERDIERCLQNEGIIRSRAKIVGAVKNARAWMTVMEAGEGAFRDLLWEAVNHRTIDRKLARPEEICALSPHSIALAKTLKKRGFVFCGPVITYAFMQAVGMFNEHLVSCPRHKACKKLARG